MRQGTRTTDQRTEPAAVDPQGREKLINYSLAMSQIVQRGDVSGEGLDDDERRLFSEMTGKLSKDQVELNQILNSAIAQHAQRRDRDSAARDAFSASRIGFSADISRLEPEPVYEATDYGELVAEQAGAPPGGMDPQVYAQVM